LAFLEGAAFFAAAFALLRLPEKADIQPSAYR
jgi:hypothetical protein